MRWMREDKVVSYLTKLEVISKSTYAIGNAYFELLNGNWGLDCPSIQVGKVGVELFDVNSCSDLAVLATYLLRNTRGHVQVSKIEKMEVL